MLGTVLLNDKRLKFFVGLNTGYVSGGTPDERLIQFYSLRSSPALHCAIVGNVVIPGGHGSNRNSATISTAPEWARVANEIAVRGTLPGLQLATAWEGYAGSRSFRSRTAHETITQSRELVRQLGRAGILSVLTALDLAADLAVQVGFRHLQIHAAHGYLFNLLVDDRLNEHAPEVRERLTEWISRHSAAGVETSIRISLRSGNADFDMQGGDQFHSQIADLPFDFIDVSSGFYNVDKQLIYPARPEILQDRRTQTIALANRFTDKRFIFSGRAMLKSEEDLPGNIHIGLCRDLIANPYYLTNQQKSCNNSGKCHYFSRGEESLSCSQWSGQD